MLNKLLSDCLFEIKFFGLSCHLSDNPISRWRNTPLRIFYQNWGLTYNQEIKGWHLVIFSTEKGWRLPWRILISLPLCYTAILTLPTGDGFYVRPHKRPKTHFPKKKWKPRLIKENKCYMFQNSFQFIIWHFEKMTFRKTTFNAPLFFPS